MRRGEGWPPEFGCIACTERHRKDLKTQSSTSGRATGIWRKSSITVGPKVTFPDFPERTLFLEREGWFLLLSPKWGESSPMVSYG